MERWKKITLGAVGGAVVIGGAIIIPPMLRANAASPELDTIPKAMVHKIGISGITLRLDVQLKNPTNADFKMKYPYFRLLYKGEVIGTSQSINEDVGIPHMGEANFNNILITIPLFSAFTVVAGLLKAIQNKEVVKLEVVTKTHIDPYWKYEEGKQEWKRVFHLGSKNLFEVTKRQTINLIG